MNDGLVAITNPDTVNAHAWRVLYHESSGHVFVGARTYAMDVSGTRLDLPGAIYMLPSADSTTWYRQCGGDSTDWQDFRALVQSSEGDVIYAGTRGRQKGIGTVLKCSDPDSTTTAWTALANETSYPFGFEVPFWAFGAWNYENYCNQHFTDVRSLAVDPNDPDVVYAGMECEGAMEPDGLWKYDGNGNWTKVSEGEIFTGMGVTAIEFRPADNCLMIGTNAQELYWHIGPHPGPPKEWSARLPVAPGLKILALTQGAPAREAQIKFSLDRPTRLEMQIFDVTGRLVLYRDLGVRPAGVGNVAWDGRSNSGDRAACGVYFVRLTAEKERLGGKLVLVR